MDEFYTKASVLVRDLLVIPVTFVSDVAAVGIYRKIIMYANCPSCPYSTAARNTTA